MTHNFQGNGATRHIITAPACHEQEANGQICVITGDSYVRTSGLRFWCLCGVRVRIPLPAPFHGEAVEIGEPHSPAKRGVFAGLGVRFPPSPLSRDRGGILADAPDRDSGVLVAWGFNSPRSHHTEGRLHFSD